MEPVQQEDRKNLPIALRDGLKGLEFKYDGRAHDHKVVEETLINRIWLFVKGLVAVYNAGQKKSRNSKLVVGPC